MSKLLKSIERQIDIDKEIINVLPKAGIKQIKELQKKLKSMLEKYNKMNESVKKEMIRRYNNITGIKENEEIAKTKKHILELENLGLSDSGPSSFQKMQLDKLLYNINGYYKKDLSTINLEILKCVKKFRDVGIKITKNDFNISEYVNEYMSVLLDELVKGSVNSDRVKEAFDKVYWKCSDLIPHIIVNIRQIYNQHEAEIDIFYKNKNEQLLNQLHLTQEQVHIKKQETVKLLNSLESVDGKNILNNFFNNNYSISDYKDENYKKIYENLISRELSSLTEEEKKSMDLNIQNLNNNLVEYTNYLEFKFLIDEILKLRDERIKELQKEEENKKNKKDKKDKNSKKNKTELESLEQEIKTLTEDILKINSSMEPQKAKFSIFKKKEEVKNDTAKILDRDKKIMAIKELYVKLDNCKLKETIVNNIDDTSKLIDVLRFASYDYGFLARSIIKKIPDILEKDIHIMIDRIRRFVSLYDFSVINNINISEKKDISIVIKDKYKLFGMTLTKENFSEDNIEELIKQIQIVKVYNDIQKSNILLDDIRYVINAREILKK